MKKEKQKYPKAMTIRYDAEQEKQILKMMEGLEEKTMSKAFLRTPLMLHEAIATINRLIADKEKLVGEITELRSVLSAWKNFDDKLKGFVEQKKG